MVRKLLLVCGILSSLLYVAMNIFVPLQYKGYNAVSQTISELSAIDAPTRPLWLVLGFIYTLLVIAFGWGIWMSARKNRKLRISGGLLIAYGLSGFAWPFAPMHQREVLATGGGTLADTMHLVLGGVTVLIYMIALGFGAAAFGKRFRVYSIATFVTLIGFGILVGLDGPKIGANQPTPWVGVTERIDIGVFLLWIMVLAIVILRDPNPPDF